MTRLVAVLRSQTPVPHLVRRSRERTVEVYRDPVVALLAGRRRMAHAGREAHESTGMERDDA